MTLGIKLFTFTYNNNLMHAKYFSHVNSCNPDNNPVGSVVLSLPFIDDETEREGN